MQYSILVVGFRLAKQTATQRAPDMDLWILTGFPGRDNHLGAMHGHAGDFSSVALVNRLVQRRALVLSDHGYSRGEVAESSLTIVVLFVVRQRCVF